MRKKATEFTKRTMDLGENSQVILIKTAEIKVIKAPRKICFKEFAYPQLDVNIIELVYLDQEFAVLVDEEGLYNNWDSKHVIYKENQNTASFVGNGMIVNISETGEVNSLTDEDVEKFNNRYKIK